MPDKNLTVISYAATASLAAAVLVYCFSPSFFIDADESSTGLFSSKRSALCAGIANSSGNDCFINSALQALAGLKELRVFLARELHRRELDGPEVYDALPPVLKKGQRPERIRDLQHGLVTRGLKDILDALNERPLYKKTISNGPFISTLERAYNTRISRNQQDAQEFLQIVLERLHDEYKAGQTARARSDPISEKEAPEDTAAQIESDKAVVAAGEGFPFEGRLESQIQCMYCGFKTKPSVQTFVSLTLNVPQGNSTTLDRCFDILLKTEEIEDYRCDRCRLKHALEWKQTKLNKATQEDTKKPLREDIIKLERAIETDPETEPEGVELPDSAQAPKRSIKKYMRITTFPRVIAIHLSRSVYDSRSYSTKNMAKVNYTERLRLGGILNEHWYRLMSQVSHKGSHNSGHYESFRRNHTYAPVATKDLWAAYGASMKANSATSSPVVGETNSVSPSTTHSTPSSDSVAESRPTTSEALEKPVGPATLQRTATQGSRPQIQSHVSYSRQRKRKRNDVWWRVSDDKVSIAKTSTVLAMQREAYLFFYSIEKPETMIDE